MPILHPASPYCVSFSSIFCFFCPFFIFIIIKPYSSTSTPSYDPTEKIYIITNIKFYVPLWLDLDRLNYMMLRRNFSKHNILDILCMIISLPHLHQNVLKVRTGKRLIILSNNGYTSLSPNPFFNHYYKWPDYCRCLETYWRSLSWKQRKQSHETWWLVTFSRLWRLVCYGILYQDQIHMRFPYKYWFSICGMESCNLCSQWFVSKVCSHCHNHSPLKSVSKILGDEVHVHPQGMVHD